MKWIFIISSLLFCSLFATAQRKTPFYTPPADTAKNKSADSSKYKKAVAVAIAKPDFRVIKM
jgi:predicted small lipoprotein YifL